MEITQLSVDVRTQQGKGGARKIRARGKIPAILYGKNSENILLGFITLLKTAKVDNLVISNFISALGKPDDEMDEHIKESMYEYRTDRANMNSTKYYQQFVVAWNAFITGTHSSKVNELEKIDKSLYMLLPE